jgi:hypothetical protein
MDKVAHYQKIIKEGLSSYAELLENSTPKFPSDLVLAFDDQHHQYLLRELGWTKDDRIQRTILHIALKNGKIWIEEDWTEEGIATYFLEHDVPREDIVLGFQPPQMRPYTEFAVA